MNEKVTSALQKAQQERKRGQFARAVRRLEQAIASFPDELDLYLEAVNACLEGGEVMQATNFIKSVQDKFTRERERVSQFLREKMATVHDPSLARCVVEDAVKRRDLEAAAALLESVPDHTVRDLFNRAKTKMQSLKSATHGGYTLRGEMVTNELTNVLLSARLGNMKEAMATVVKVLEDKPVEHKVLDPFLAALEVKHNKSGRIRFARGCALRAGGNEVEALHRFVEAARLEPACAAVCAEQLKAMAGHTHHPAKVQRALAEVLLIKGDLDEAASTLRTYLEANPDNGREIVMLVRPFLDESHGLNACTWLVIDAALSIEQSALALEILRPLQQRGAHGPELYEWLENRAASGFLPTDVMMFHGSLAIEQGQLERAAEILGAVCSSSPQDVPAVLTIVERHRGAHAALDALYLKHAATAPEEAGDDADAGDFQMFENREFRPETSGGFETSSPGARAKAAPSSASGRQPPPKKSLVDTQELSLEELATADPVAAFAATESHVTNVAQKLYEAGAAAFFHIDGPGDAPGGPDEPAPSPSRSSAGRVHSPGRIPAPVEPPETGEEFAALFERFRRGELDNRAVLALIEYAARSGRADELRELLYFEPETGAEHFARYYFQAEYEVLRNRPLQALEILARLDTPDLDDESRSRVWLKIAICQRMVRNFAGAGDTLRRLVERFPDRPEFARLKRRNQEELLDEQGRQAAVLEKTSSLN